MSDLYNLFLNASWVMAPLFAFLIGAAGSLHCVGMCGGLSLAVGGGQVGLWQFNIGRLFGYFALLSVFAGFGAIFTDPEIKRVFASFGGIFAGGFMVFVGIQSIRGREPRFNIPFFEKAYGMLFKKFAKAKVIKAFALGMSSMMLPCALSNGFILAALSLGGGWAALPMIVFFWAGTLPGMIMGPDLARNLVRKFGIKAQRVTGVMFLCAGCLALVAKIIHAWDIGLLCFT